MRPLAGIPQPSLRWRVGTTYRAAANVAAVCVAMVWLAAPTDAMAGSLCRTAMFQCSGPITGGINLRKAVGSRARARQVLKNCRPFYTSLEPDRCDWRRTLRTGRLGAAPRVTRPVPAGAALPTPSGTAATGPRTATRTPTSIGLPARVQPTPPQPTIPRRDVRGRYSTTPAPTRIPRVTAQDRAPFAAEVRSAAARYKLPGHLVRAVMKVESGYNPTVVSSAGAIGLMQLLPTTAKAMGVKDARDPAQSIQGGTRFLRILANRFRGDLVKVLSAYHAGSTRVRRRGGTPYAATDSYVRKVLGVYYALQDQ